MKNCIFCKIANKEIPAYIFWENENFIAFLDIFPVIPGATVVISKKHHPSYIKNTPKELVADIMEAMQEVMEILDSKLEGNLRTKLIFEGLEVDHLHAKLWPIYKGIREKTPEKSADGKALEKLAQKLRN